MRASIDISLDMFLQWREGGDWEEVGEGRGKGRGGRGEGRWKQCKQGSRYNCTMCGKATPMPCWEERYRR